MMRKLRDVCKKKRLFRLVHRFDFSKMRKQYTFSDGESFTADEAELRRRLDLNRSYLQNYEEVESNLDDDAYIARGNGFCDAKYSPDFIEGQMEKYRRRVNDLLQWLNG